MAAAETKVRDTVPAKSNGNGKAANSRRDVPVVYKDSAYRLITPQVREVLDGVLKVVQAQIREEAIKPERVEIYGTPDYDEVKGNIIILAWTEMESEPAFAFWDRLADAVQAWIETLPESQEAIACDLIGTEVRWRVANDGL